jgi:Ca2+-binding RTX toxin-like protein
MSPARKRRRLTALLAAAAAAVGVFLTFGAGSAAAFTCTGATGADGNDVILSLVNESVVLAKGNLSQITANGVPCSNGATTSNTETIFVLADNSGAGGQPASLIIDEGGGRFEPGVNGAATTVEDETLGLNEIEFVLIETDPAPDGFVLDFLTILGNAAPDTINLGNGLLASADDQEAFVQGAVTVADATDEVGWINLNGDDDADIFTDGPIKAIFIEVFGRGGNDTLTAKGGKGTGDAVNFSLIGLGFHTLALNGGDGDDSIQGGDGDDWLTGGPGNDVIDGDDNTTPGFSFCFGFAVNISTGEVDAGTSFVFGDVIDYSGSTGPITLDLDPGELHPGTATGDGTDVIQNVEHVNGSPGNDVLSGDNVGNAIYGNGGDDTIAGDAGSDCEFGGGGNDTFDENEGTSTAQGGTGTDNGADLIFGNAGLDDTVTYSSRTTRINVYLEPILFGAVRGTLGEEVPCTNAFDVTRSTLGGPVFFAPDGSDLDGDGFSGDDERDCIFHDTENAITGSGNDLMSAAFVNNRADNEFTGNAGNDLMDGGAGNDTFHEGSAANGADDMDGGTGSDTCDYSQRTNPVSVNLDGADNDGEAGEGDNCGGVVNIPLSAIAFLRATQGFFGFEGDPIAGQDVENVAGGSGNDNLTGSDEANVLTGNAGNDTLTGNGGTDVLNGGDGDDWMVGGAGNDSLAGGAGTDTADYSSAGAGGVGVNVNLTTGQASGDGNDTISDTENASGSSFSDSIRGSSGANVLNGRGGEDAIQGGDEADTVNGGAGADVLNGNGGNDRISGGTGQDTIRGGAGNDNANGGPAADTIYGGVGNDVLSGGAGPDDMRGGAGTDRCNPGAPGFGRGDTATGCES